MPFKDETKKKKYGRIYRLANAEKQREYHRTWCRANGDKRRAYANAYNAANKVFHKGTMGQVGAAAEHHVIADLNWHGFEVTRPTDPQCPHDMHARIDRLWFTIQVKATGTNIKTGRVIKRDRRIIRSEIIAWVLPDRTIQYESNTDQELPPELEEGNVHLYQLICDSCDLTYFKHLTMRERTTKAHFCPSCGEQTTFAELKTAPQCE